MRTAVLFSVLLTGLFLLAPSDVLAARHRPPRGSGQTAPATRQTTGSSRGIKTSVRFRHDRQALLITFSGFNDNIVSVSYAFTYNANGVPQGVRSTVTAASEGDQREFLFGTCSHGVCRYHSNISSARLVIDTQLTSGITIRKPYRIKV